MHREVSYNWFDINQWLKMVWHDSAAEKNVISWAESRGMLAGHSASISYDANLIQRLLFGFSGNSTNSCQYFNSLFSSVTCI